MTKLEKILIALLRCAIRGERVYLSVFGALSMTNWLVVLDLACRQNVVELAFLAVKRLDKCQLPHMELLMDWLGQTSYIET